MHISGNFFLFFGQMSGRITRRLYQACSCTYQFKLPVQHILSFTQIRNAIALKGDEYLHLYFMLVEIFVFLSIYISVSVDILFISPPPPPSFFVIKLSVIENLVYSCKKHSKFECGM